MYKLCKTEQSAARQRELEQGLLEIMANKRFDDISVSDLCEKIGIPRKSFYRYFSGKDGALYALIDHTLMAYEGFLPERFLREKRTVQNDLVRFFMFWKENQKLLDALNNNGLSGVLIERAVTYAVSDDVLPVRFLPGESKSQQQHVVMFGVCGLLSMVLAWHREHFPETPEQLAEVAFRVLSKPLFPDPNAKV